MSLLTFQGEKLLLDGKDFYLASGSMHYFRFQPGGWRHRLKLMKVFGLTAVQTYVPWNLHEPHPDEFHFEGSLNLRAFLEMCQEEGLYVMLRPSPYICSECDWGGMPSWLMQEDVCPRTMDEGFIKPYKHYFDRLCQEFVPMLSTNGGPIIAVALENEYGSYAMDLEYIRYCENLYRENGIDVPLFTAGGAGLSSLIFGGPSHIWAGLDLRGGVPAAIEVLHQYQTDFPTYIAEFWGGRAQQWGGFFFRQPAEVVAENYREALEAGAYVNFYMFCGGTNFGFFSGANHGTFRSDVPNARFRYLPLTTSYDVDAPIDEQGRPTKKYFLCREVLAKYRGMRLEDLPPVPENMPTQAPTEIHWQESRRLFQPEVLDALTWKKVKSGNVRTMESMKQDYGWILYTTHILRTNPDHRFQLILDGLHDRADIYVDGEYKGTYYRDRDNEPMEFYIRNESVRLDILVENMGRCCFGYSLLQDKKGILDCVRWNVLLPDGQEGWCRSFISNWENRALPMTNDLLNAAYTPANTADARVQPRLYRGTFSAQAGIDTCLDFVHGVNGKTGLHKGFIRVNGFNLGRYWEIGPQETLYIPGDLLREENTIEIFELYGTEDYPAPTFRPDISLDGLTENVEILLNK